ncbi:hypothetical protein TSAR_013400 [Trichomalopsis sarcophagae]|uniref:Uncharacterized protein n=1 Tax=Trichomalopsis sarcophagae TaxID=543379 RepID=A0A232EEB6_9HYME|nr:hypothetical protein TSAR_013400 [Trichomalopsis sarcophagae]
MKGTPVGRTDIPPEKPIPHDDRHGGVGRNITHSIRRTTSGDEPISTGILPRTPDIHCLSNADAQFDHLVIYTRPYVDKVPGPLRDELMRNFASLKILGRNADILIIIRSRATFQIIRNIIAP